MEIKKLVDTINRTYISSDYLRQPDIYYYMDRVIDDINENLQASFPTFSEWEDFVEEYNKQFNLPYVESDETESVVVPNPDAEDHNWQRIGYHTQHVNVTGINLNVTFITEARYGAPLSDRKHRVLEVRQMIMFNANHIQITGGTVYATYTTTYCSPIQIAGNHTYYPSQVLNHGQLIIEQPEGAAKTVNITSTAYDSYMQINGTYSGTITLPAIPEVINVPQPGLAPRPPRPRPPRPRPIPRRKPVPIPPQHVYENQKLWADFGPKDRTVYDAFPDKYLRSVVALGAALYYYEADEEGEQIAMDYQRRYEQQLFYMVRDYQMLVPPMYQNNFGGYIDFSHERELGPHNLHPRGVVMRGYNSRIL